MVHKSLNLSKITMGYALGVGLLIGSIPIAKAEYLLSGSKYEIEVEIYTECDIDAVKTPSSQNDSGKNAKGAKEVISAIFNKVTDWNGKELEKLKQALKSSGCKFNRTYVFPQNPKLVDAQGYVIPEKMFKTEVKAGDVILAKKTGISSNHRPVICTINKDQNLALMTIKSRTLKKATKDLFSGFSGISGDAGLMCVYQ